MLLSSWTEVTAFGERSGSDLPLSSPTGQQRQPEQAPFLLRVSWAQMAIFHKRPRKETSRYRTVLP